MFPLMLSDPPDDVEWTEPTAESDGKKPLEGTAYNITSENDLSNPFLGGLSYGLGPRSESPAS